MARRVEYIRKSGTEGDDELVAPGGPPIYIFSGLGGDDTYTLRLATRTITQDFGDPSKEVYVRDSAIEKAGAGYDTARLVNSYGPVGFTGITPIGSLGPADLANVEHIVATPTPRGGKLIAWNIAADAGDNRIDAPASGDVLDGGAGDDRINAGGGADRLLGGRGNDSLFGDAGDDVLAGGPGANLLHGGAGNDTASFADAAKGLTINLGSGAKSVADRLISIESLIGGRFADRLVGSAGNNNLSGENGNDSLSGGAGDDTVSGGNGDDTVAGGDGNDALEGGAGSDILAGGAGNDAVNGGGGADRLSGGAGSDRFEFDFSFKTGRDGVYLVYKRDILFDATISDFQDGIDRIVVDQNISGSAMKVTDFFVEQVGRDAKLYFGDPANSGVERQYRDLSFGSVALKNFDADNLSSADFLFI